MKIVDGLKEHKKIFRNIVIVLILLVLILAVLKIAPDYIRDDSIKDRTNLVINSSNVTSRLKREETFVFQDSLGVFYMEVGNIRNFFDKYLTYDETYDMYITTYDSHIATIENGKSEITLDGKKQPIVGKIMKRDGKVYLPISDLKDVYGIELKNLKDIDTIFIDSLDTEQIRGNSKKRLKCEIQIKIIM